MTFPLSRKWIAVVILATGIKLGLILMSPAATGWGDFYNWVLNAQKVILLVNGGHVSLLLRMGAYLGLSVLISPLFWLWTLLPVQHLAVTQIAAHPSLSYSFLLVLKLPLLAFDLATGLLVKKLVQIHNPTLSGNNAFLAWYLNPYNWVWLYWYSTYDIIPTAIVTLSVLVALKGRWLRSGLCLSIAFLLRLFPIFIFPFFLVFANKASRRSVLRVAAGFGIPIVLVLIGISIASGSIVNVTELIATTALRQSWLLDFYGFSVTDSSISLTPFLLLVQLYLVLMWANKDYSLMHGTLASLLATFVASYHHGYHFLWTTPFLTSYADIDRTTIQLYALTYFCAFLSPITYEGGVIAVLDPYYHPLWALGLAITAGAFVACKAFYLLRINFIGILEKSKLSSVPTRASGLILSLFSRTPSQEYPMANAIHRDCQPRTVDWSSKLRRWVSDQAPFHRAQRLSV